ncbi:Crp/Fnr family transcriptional regulator [Pedobacter sp.]|uniref:Crp/Fnr family transcriptional regulator n=1 Tax=Pedobacter sp. TaxID=1411316 RepID=UPI003BAD9A0A
MHQLILNNFALHIALAPEEQEQALACFQLQEIKKRIWLLRAGETDRYIYFVKRGCLRMYYTDKSGGDHIIGFYPENWWCCDIASFFNSSPSVNAIQTLEDSEIYSISLPRLEELFLLIPKFERFFRILNQNGFDLYQHRMTSQLYKTAEERYLEFRKRHPGLEQRIAQKHIASYIGITPAFLSMMRKENGI